MGEKTVYSVTGCEVSSSISGPTTLLALVVTEREPEDGRRKICRCHRSRFLPSVPP